MAQVLAGSWLPPCTGLLLAATAPFSYAQQQRQVQGQGPDEPKKQEQRLGQQAAAPQRPQGPALKLVQCVNSAGLSWAPAAGAGVTTESPPASQSPQKHSKAAQLLLPLHPHTIPCPPPIPTPTHSRTHTSLPSTHTTTSTPPRQPPTQPAHCGRTSHTSGPSPAAGPCPSLCRPCTACPAPACGRTAPPCTREKERRERATCEGGLEGKCNSSEQAAWEKEEALKGEEQSGGRQQFPLD